MSLSIAYSVHGKCFHFVMLLIQNVSSQQRKFKQAYCALISLMNQFNNFTDDEKENKLKLPNCKYREIYYFQKHSKNFTKGRPCPFTIWMFVHLPKTLMIQKYTIYLLLTYMWILIFLQLQNHALRKICHLLKSSVG